MVAPEFRSSSKSFLTALCVATAAFLVPERLDAHPHEFVSMHVKAEFDDGGLLNGLTYHWNFDEFFTAYAVEGQDKNKNGIADTKEEPQGQGCQGWSRAD